jgi:hypothetical protein
MAADAFAWRAGFAPRFMAALARVEKAEATHENRE